jgi:hypothetical protein
MLGHPPGTRYVVTDRMVLQTLDPWEAQRIERGECPYHLDELEGCDHWCELPAGHEGQHQTTVKWDDLEADTFPRERRQYLPPWRNA